MSKITLPRFLLPTTIGRNRLEPGNLDNPALAYYQFLPCDLKDDGKAGHLKKIREQFNEGGPWRDACTYQADRLLATAKGLEAQGRPVAIIEATTSTRLLVGMGYKNTLEVGMTFHRPGGFPYLPGSSLKGLCRAWRELVIASDDTSDLQRIFGSASKDEDAEASKMIAGSVCFLDAYPTKFPRLDVDLMSPHFSKYYNDENNVIPPGDWLEPIVIPFLAVAAGQSFQFILVGRNAAVAEDVEQASGWLELALADLGAGGKTAAGYGYFEEIARVACESKQAII